MTTVQDVVNRHHALLKERRAAMDELGYQDITEEARLIEGTRLLRDILAAYVTEQRPVADGETLGRLYALDALLSIETVDIASVRAVVRDAIGALGGAA